MKRVAMSGWGALMVLLSATASARGPSPYLPLNLEPEIERQIERVLVLADKPVMARPIPVAVVLDALPHACPDSQELCDQVRRFLDRYLHDAGISYASGEIAESSKVEHVIPNEHGLLTTSHYDIDAAAYWQPYDHLVVTLGGIAYKGRAVPTGSMISAGWDFAQLDIGWRDHWLSPSQESAMLSSTEAPTMPSVTLSNYSPLSPLGIQYELFLARMSRSDHIALPDGTFTSGNPLLAGMHLGIEPAVGWSLAFNRDLQFGGGAFGGTSLNEVLRAVFDPVSAQHPGSTPGLNQAYGNQEASITSRFIFPGKNPFAVYFEYAGEDTSRARNYLLGDVGFTAGIHFPRLANIFDVTYEITDWQEAWYVHNIYQDGMTNDLLALGNWFGDERQFNDGVGGQSNVLRIGWEPPFGGLLEERFRTIVNANYGYPTYKHGYDGMIRYSRPWRAFTVGGEIYAGRDVFGSRFTRIAAFMRLGNEGASSTAQSDEEKAATLSSDQAQVFVDAGATAYSVLVDLTETTPRVRTATKESPHLGIGARRPVSEHQDLGARIEAFDISGRGLIAARLLDYRYRFEGHMAVGAFFGGARYALATPAYGYYYGLDAAYRDLIPGWDLSIDAFYGDKVARRHVLATDPHTQRPDSFYDITGISLSVSRHFSF